MRVQKNRRGPGGPCLNVPQKLVFGAFCHWIGDPQTTQMRALTAARQALERLQLLVQRRSSLWDQLAPQLKPGRVFPVPLAVIQVGHDSAGMLDDGDESMLDTINVLNDALAVDGALPLVAPKHLYMVSQACAGVPK